MPKFFSVLLNNLICAFCRKKNCSLRYMPERKKREFYHGSFWVRSCPKDKKKR